MADFRISHDNTPQTGIFYLFRIYHNALLPNTANPIPTKLLYNIVIRKAILHALAPCPLVKNNNPHCNAA
jgi:hypothetical protein